MALEVRRRRVGSGDTAVEIIDVVGRLDAPGGAMLRSAIQDALRDDSPRIGINLAETIEIHRETVGTLHSLGRACKRASGGLAIFGADGDVLEYIKTFADAELAPWYGTETDAVVALGGEVVDEPVESRGHEPPVIIALGNDKVFRKVFWKLGKLGGRPVAKFDNIDAVTDFLTRRRAHSILIDASLELHDVARFIRQSRSIPELRKIGIFLVGAPSLRNQGRALIKEGGDNFIPFVFSGQEIAAKLDIKAFFQRLKEAYKRLEASRN